MPAPIPLSAPMSAKTLHPKIPAAKPRLNVLKMKIGAFAIITKSQRARLMMNIFEGVRRDFELKIIILLIAQ